MDRRNKICSTMNKTDVAREYRVKFGMEMPTLKLARIMYGENKLLFSNVDHARTALRSLEGKSGCGASLKKDKGAFDIKERPRNPYNLPKSEEVIWEPYRLNFKRIGVLSDIHIPYHNIDALSVAIEYLKQRSIDCLLLNGDALDFFGLSKYCKDPKKRGFAYELDTWKAMFEIFEKEFNCPIVYKLGNHEERYEHFLWQKAGELVGVDEFEIENLLKARARGITVIKDKQIIKAGGLNIAHGHEFTGGAFAPVNVARGLFLRAKTSAMQGHNHQTSEHTEPDMDGKIVTTWSTGCLCELHPQYMPINKWNHGLALVEVDGEEFQVHNKRIYKGRIL